MRRSILLAGVLAVAAGAALAQSAAIGERKAAMKAIGAAIAPMGKMMKGEEPFALDKVQASLKVFAEKAAASTKFYPADSKEGGETKSLPAVWTDNAKFMGIFAKFEADSKSAMAAIKDEASFKTEFPKVASNCGACHNDFRAKAN